MPRASGITPDWVRRTSGAVSGPVAGFVGHWDASQITGVADGASLASWPDLSGNGYNLGQGTGADQPTYYKTTASKLVNGLPAVWFALTNDMSNTMTVAQPCTFFIVCQTSDTTDPQDIFQDRTGGMSVYRQPGHSAYDVYAGAGDNYVGTLDTKVNSLCVVFNGAASVFYQNNTASSAFNPGTGAFALGLQTGRADVGSNDGPYCEMLLYPSALSVGNIALVQSYLISKWV